MNIEKYIESAQRRIQAVPAHATGNKFYLRNRIAEIATYLAENDPGNWVEFFEYSKPDIIKCQARADHYGMRIGDSIKNSDGNEKRLQRRRVDYFDQRAKTLRIVKKSIDMDAITPLQLRLT